MAGAKHMTVGEKQKIIELFQTRVNGRSPSYTDIGREIRRSRASVRRVLEDARLVTKPRARRLTVGETKRIVELYQTRNDGRWMSTVEIGKIVGRSAGTVHEVVSKAGIARTKSEAATVHVPEPVRQKIIRCYVATGLASTNVARRLKLKPTLVYKVLDESDVIIRRGQRIKGPAIRIGEAELIVALYRQGRSVTDVADLTDRSVKVAQEFVRQAGVMRPRKESARLAMRRIAAQNKLAKMDIRPLAARWIDGAEAEDLAAEHEVPPDLMWDALAAELSTMTPHAVSCIRTCPFACSEVCARTAEVGTSKTGRLY